MKKILIEIPDDHKRVIDNLVEDGKGYLLPQEVENRTAQAVRNGKDLSEMTVGDIIEIILPNAEVNPNPYIPSVDIYMGGILMMRVDRNLWNASYKKVVEN